MPETEISKPLTTRICELHSGVSRSTAEALRTCIDIGGLIALAYATPGFDFDELEKEAAKVCPVPLDAKQVGRYHRLHERKEELLPHLEQMSLGFMNVPEVRDNTNRQNGPLLEWGKWTSPVNTLRQFFRLRLSESPVEQWPKDQRQLLKGQLKPIVEIYEKL